MIPGKKIFHLLPANQCCLLALETKVKDWLEPEKEFKEGLGGRLHAL